MSVLIRFEDKYGLLPYLLKCRFNSLNNFDFSKACLYKEIFKDVFITNDLGTPGVFTFDEIDDVKALYNKNITDILFVFDMDNFKESENSLLQSTDLKEIIIDIKSLLSSHNLSIKLHFIPVVYASETISLCVFGNCCTDPVQLINNKNTARLHALLLARILSIKNPKRVKNIVENIRNTDVKERLMLELHKDRHNQIALNWLLDSSNDLLSYSLSEENIYDFIDNMNIEFESFEPGDVWVYSTKMNTCNLKEIESIVRKE